MNFIAITSVLPTSLSVALEGFRAFGMFFFLEITFPTKSAVLRHGSRRLHVVCLSRLLLSCTSVLAINQGQQRVSKPGMLARTMLEAGKEATLHTKCAKLN